LIEELKIEEESSCIEDTSPWKIEEENSDRKPVTQAQDAEGFVSDEIFTRAL